MPLIPDPTRTAEAGWKVLGWLRARLPRDHATINEGWWTKRYGQWSHFYSVAACAPSKRFRHPHQLTPEDALAFAETVIPGTFSFPPTTSSRDLVSFETRDDPTSTEVLQAVRIYANGLVEFLVRVPMALEDERVMIGLLDVSKPWYNLACAVRAGAYRDVYGLRTRSRRLDWFAAVSGSISSEKGSLSWTDLTFPGRRPQNRATNSYPAHPPYGREGVFAHRQRTDPLQLARLMITDFVGESGWIGTDGAVEDTICSLDGSEPDELG